jgi:hypothetical protein
MQTHVQAVMPKLSYIRASLSSVIRKGNFRYNVSLFRTIIMPQAILHGNITTTAKVLIII